MSGEKLPDWAERREVVEYLGEHGVSEEALFGSGLLGLVEGGWITDGSYFGKRKRVAEKMREEFGVKISPEGMKDLVGYLKDVKRSRSAMPRGAENLKEHRGDVVPARNSGISILNKDDPSY